ncbi:hypothetical protein C9446_20335 (plasmid) [Providencia heimbachae]|nr:hypothetical protein C9446_20335 [Providencia heimbachae]
MIYGRERPVALIGKPIGRQKLGSLKYKEVKGKALTSRMTGRIDIPQHEEKHRFDAQQKARSHRAPGCRILFCRHEEAVRMNAGLIRRGAGGRN